jgi:hypothetical protein
MEDDSSMLNHAMDFYKKLFGDEAKKNIRLSENFWSADEKVFSQENEALEAKLYEDEIRKAIFESYVEGAPGPDGFPFLFYQKFRNVIKINLMRIVRIFDKEGSGLSRLNYASVTLIPKEEGARTLKKFRPDKLQF